MVTPSPRGFPRHSNTAQVCGLAEDFRRKSRQRLFEPPPERPLEADLAVLFDLRCRKPNIAPAHELDRTPTATVDLTVTEKRMLIPTGERHKKKDGTLGAEHKIPFILVTVTATIVQGKHRAFFYRVTNRSTRVFDSRTNTRRPIGEVLYELHRMCPAAIADSTADSLAEWLQPERQRKPRKRDFVAAPPSPPPIPALRRAANKVVAMLRADPVLDYLNQPLPYPDVKIS